MAYAAALDNVLALSPQSIDGIRSTLAHGDTKSSLKSVASQFEAYFMQMMLRTMRQTLPQDGLFDSDETRSFTEMYDQQISQSVSRSKGLGLADMIIKQLSPQTDATKATVSSSLPESQSTRSLVNKTVAITSVAEQTPSESITPRFTDETKTSSAASARSTAAGFIDQIWPQAVEAAKTLGVSPQVVVAHAALESGWGKHQLKDEQGQSTHNIFNVKAGSQWQGKTVEKVVTEYVNGKPTLSQEKFRAYPSKAEAFSDYAKLLSSNPRYVGVINQDVEGFAKGLQRGGFATDPMYADKLQRVIQSSTFKSGLAG